VLTVEAPTARADARAEGPIALTHSRHGGKARWRELDAMQASTTAAIKIRQGPCSPPQVRLDAPTPAELRGTQFVRGASKMEV
jgi:hypothetical protein